MIRLTVTLATSVLIISICAAATTPPPASLSDRIGIVMGVKKPPQSGQVLMVGVLNASTTYERSATPAQIRACTRHPHMNYPACLPTPRRGHTHR